MKVICEQSEVAFEAPKSWDITVSSAMTANAMESDREKALEAGMDDYVSKPVKAEELDTVLERWLLQDEEKVGQDTSAPGAGNGTAAAPNGSLDHSVLEGLRELQEEGEPDVLAELGKLLLEDVPPHLEALRRAIEANDASSVERVAHTLKGSSSNLGALRMATLCAELEDIGHSGDLSRAPVLIERLEAEFGRVREALDAEMERSSSRG